MRIQRLLFLIVLIIQLVIKCLIKSNYKLLKLLNKIKFIFFQMKFLDFLNITQKTHSPQHPTSTKRELAWELCLKALECLG